MSTLSPTLTRKRNRPAFELTATDTATSKFQPKCFGSLPSEAASKQPRSSKHLTATTLATYIPIMNQHHVY